MCKRLSFKRVSALALFILSASCGSNTNNSEDNLTGQLLVGDESNPIASGAILLFQEDAYYGQLTLTDGVFQQTEVAPEDREPFILTTWSDATVAFTATLRNSTSLDSGGTFIFYDSPADRDYIFTDASIERYGNGGALHLDNESLKIISGTIHIQGTLPNISVTVDGQLENGVNVSATGAGALVIDEIIAE